MSHSASQYSGTVACGAACGLDKEWATVHVCVRMRASTGQYGVGVFASE
jgi:hypothetical protein